MHDICKLQLAELSQRLNDSAREISYCERVVEYLVKVGTDNLYGARPLARSIKRLIENHYHC